jgi:hypothetical protein
MVLMLSNDAQPKPTSQDVRETWQIVSIQSRQVMISIVQIAKQVIRTSSPSLFPNCKTAQGKSELSNHLHIGKAPGGQVMDCVD